MSFLLCLLIPLLGGLVGYACVFLGRHFVSQVEIFFCFKQSFPYISFIPSLHSFKASR